MQQNIQPKDEQVKNEHAKSQQPKKAWVEPELVSMGVESGGPIDAEVTNFSAGTYNPT